MQLMPFETAVTAVEGLLEQAVAAGASDIHCDPYINGIHIKLRVDGIMKDLGLLKKDIHDEFIARLKILSSVRTDIHAIPQDGRFQTSIAGHPYNVRISFMPTYYGENAVMRLLPTKDSTETSFERLGFTADHSHAICTALQRTSGLILVTGPTGSGKTTTLHACLMHKSAEPLAIITLEDPVEYEVPAVRQVHIQHSHGVTFSSGLRAALRQDPDVIMVGEVRDAETARVAIHTALTGHLVLSTLHTNSALEAIPRLIDMGVDSYLLASTLKLVIAQRLIRVMCKECYAEGCGTCNGSGYVGRSLLAEVYEISSEMRELIIKRSSLQACLKKARKEGFSTMLDDGDEKVEWGVTTREEVKRVLSE